MQLLNVNVSILESQLKSNQLKIYTLTQAIRNHKKMLENTKIRKKGEVRKKIKKMKNICLKLKALQKKLL